LPLALKRPIRSAELEVRPASRPLRAVRERRRRLGVEAALWRDIRRGNEDERVDRLRLGLRTWPPLLILLVLLIAACSKGKSDSDQASSALAAGLEAHAAGRLDEAEADYRKVLVYDPRNKFAYYNLGVIEQTQGDGGSAESDYRIALTIDPDFVPALFNLAILRTSSGGDREAIDLYKHVIQIDEGYAAAHLNLGFLLIDNGQEKEGKAELAIAVGLDPTLADRIPEDLQTGPVRQPSHSVGPQASGSTTS
jgi:tetratricopeptide (TPR) repeat protein